LFTLDHNFWTRNPSRSSKSIKRLGLQPSFQ